MPRLPATHAALALLVVAVWGTNFVVIKAALEAFSPLWLAVLRYSLALAPLLLLVVPVFGNLGTRWKLARPAVSWRNLLTYGALIGAGQFGLLFTAMNGHISPGLASLVVQTQVFFTIGLAMVTAGERPRAYQGLALVPAVAGLVLIGSFTDGLTTPLGLAMVLLAAAAWAGGNIVARRAKGANALAYVIWSSLGAVPPLLVLAWFVEGPHALVEAFARATPGTWLAVAWQTVGNTFFGYGAWGWLLQRHEAATIVPWALLVPVFGMSSAALLVGEPMPWWKLVAAALVIGGLSISVVWPMLRRG